MKLPFGYEIAVKAGALVMGKQKAVTGLSSVYSPGWFSYPWIGPIYEGDTGNWQRNVVVAPTQTLLSFSPVYACVTGIAADIAKMRIKLCENQDGIWKEITKNQPWLPLLRNPNRYQDRIKFIECWMLSKLLYGNTYVYKERDGRGIVRALYILHPNWVMPLIAADGSVYYELRKDELSTIPDQITVPASEIIHDRMSPLWHPLVGVSPLYACGTSATMGNTIQSNSTNFFANRSMPGGMLTAPGEITNETAARLKSEFDSRFGGTNIGKTFVAGDGLKFEPFVINAQDMQQVEQLGWTVTDVARAFRYPVWKLGGPQPPYTKPDQAQTSYYVDCLHPHIESIELCLDEGLELPLGIGTEFDLDTMFRMDTESLYESNNKASDWMKPDEKRYRANLDPLKVGGDTVYLQQQNYSIEALAKRDAKEDPFESKNAPKEPEPEPKPAAEEEPEDTTKGYDVDDLAILFGAELRKELTLS